MLGTRGAAGMTRLRPPPRARFAPIRHYGEDATVGHAFLSRFVKRHPPARQPRGAVRLEVGWLHHLKDSRNAPVSQETGASAPLGARERVQRLLDALLTARG